MDLPIKQSLPFGTIGIVGLVKVYTLAIIGIGFALGFSWFLRQFLFGGVWSQLAISAACAIGFLVIFTLQTFFIRSLMQFAAIFLLQSIALLAFFFSVTTPILILFVVVYFLLLNASYSGRKILENTLTIDFWSISKLIAPKGIIAMTLLVSVFVPLHLQAHRDVLPVSLATFDKVLASSNVFIKRFYADFDSAKSVEEIARVATERQLAAIPQARGLSAREQALLTQSAIEDFYDQLFSYTGVAFDPRQSVSAVAYDVLQEKFARLGDSVKLWMYVILGSIIFISIASILLPVRIVVAGLAFIVYEIMIALGYVRITVENRPKEILVLD